MNIGDEITQTGKGEDYLFDPDRYELKTKVAGQTVNLKFIRLNAITKPTKVKGTILYMCGGPSSCEDRMSFPDAPGYEIVTFDPIGLGANREAGVSPEAMSLESQAEFATKIVDHLKLNNYVIVGKSFGSSIATVAAANIQKQPTLTPPKAVVLEGTFGPRSTAVRGWLETSQRSWALLNPKEQSNVATRLERLQALNPQAKNKLVNDSINWLGKGPRYTAGKWREFLQQPLKFSKDSAAPTSVKVNAGDDGYSKLYDAAGCQSIRHVDDPQAKSPYWFPSSAWT